MVDIDTIPVSEYERSIELDNVPQSYRQVRDRDEIPVHTGLAIDHWDHLETDDWDRTGQQGAYINLYGAEGINDMQLHELALGGKTSWQHHLYDELVYVSKGSGITIVGRGDDSIRFEWSENSLFFLPPNTPYRHVNIADEPARLVAETSLPQLCNTYGTAEPILDPTENWWETFRTHDLYSASAETQVVEKGSEESLAGVPPGTVYWDANFIPDILKFDKLDSNELRGAGGTSVFFPFKQSGMYSHISEFPVGRYKKAHRHHPGANVSIISGEGFSLLWTDSIDETIKIEWDAGTVFTPPARWFHQHFNTGTEPARYFAMHGISLGTLDQAGTFDATASHNQIEYHEEDPAIRHYYEEQLAQRGIESDMPAECYTDPEYAF